MNKENKMKKLAVANGSYINAQGETKTRWVNVGVIGVSQNGKEYMLIDPTINFAAFEREGKDMVMVGIFEESGQQGQPQQGYQPPPTHYQDAQGRLVPPPQQKAYPQQTR